MEIDAHFLREVERGQIRNVDVHKDKSIEDLVDEICRLKANFENIVSICDKMTSGNVSHHIATIKGISLRNVEFIEKHFLSK